MRFVVLLITLTALGAATDWPRYRGPNGTGISPDSGAPAEIGPDRNVLWKTSTLKGNSSPILVNDRLFVTGHERDERVLLCYNAANGVLLWRKGVAAVRTEAVHPLNGPTTPTPATDGRDVFAFFPEFGMIAYDFEGNERWRLPLGPFASIQGIASSPVYVDGNVVLFIDTPEQASLQAFNARSGRQVWRVERPIGFLGSYATPSVYKPAGGPTQIVVAGAIELAGYDARSGERVWWARGITNGPAALPLISGDFVYTVEPSGEGAPPFGNMLKDFDKNKNGQIEITEIVTGNTSGRIMYRLFKSIDKVAGNGDGIATEAEYDSAFSPKNPAGGLVSTRLTGKGDVSKTHVQWRHAKGMPYIAAPLLYDNVLYVIRDGGILATFDPVTGKRLREDRLKDALGAYYSSPVASGGKIYFVSKEGKVTVIRTGLDWTILHSASLDEEVIATPAISGARIYVRTANSLYCFSSVQAGAPAAN